MPINHNTDEMKGLLSLVQRWTGVLWTSKSNVDKTTAACPPIKAYKYKEFLLLLAMYGSSYMNACESRAKETLMLARQLHVFLIHFT